MAVAALVLGIVAIVFTFIPYGMYLAAPSAFLGIIFGAIGIGQAGKTGQSKGLAIAGMVCSIVAVVLWLIVYLWLMFALSSEFDMLDFEGF